MIEIVDYDPRWPDEFEALARPIRAALGGFAARVDHIGSTSVPGLAAKNRIDVQVGLPDFARLADAIAALAALGFAAVPGIGSDHVPVGASEDPAEWRKAFVQPPAGSRAANVHVREVGRANWRYALLFRDYLRAHPAAAGSYAELKRRLAPFMPDGGTYAEVKDPAVDLIMLAAEDWAAATGWEPAEPSV